MSEVTHEELDAVRRELHGDHAALSESMTDDFKRIYDKLEHMQASRIKTVGWVLAFMLALIGTVYQGAQKIADGFHEHLEHSATFTQIIKGNSEEIVHNRERHNELADKVEHHINGSSGG